MIADGTIELVDNPAHRRSKLLRLTPKGERVFQEIADRIAREAEDLALSMEIEELQVAVKVLRKLGEKLKQTLV